MLAPHTQMSSNALFELRNLEALPCGCIAADYSARLLELDVFALEAKGPHCTLEHHARGLLLEPDEEGGHMGAAFV